VSQKVTPETSGPANCGLRNAECGIFRNPQFKVGVVFYGIVLKDSKALEQEVAPS